MADKYIDHGAYGGGVFNGYLTGQTLVVTSVVSGFIGLGAQIKNTAGTVLFGTYVQSLASGTLGGVGTYNVRIAPSTDGVNQAIGTAGAPVQFSCVNGTPLDLIPTSLWGIPQDGDGTAPTKAAASAVVTIDLTGKTAPYAATNTPVFTVGGAAFTCVSSGAGAGQFNGAASATALATSLVAAINFAGGNSPAVSALDTGWVRMRANEMFFARIDPGSTSRIQIMTRAGSASFNNNAGFKVLSANFTGGQVNSVFSGGSGGCWGFIQAFETPSNIWPSGMAGSGGGGWDGTSVGGYRTYGAIGHAVLAGSRLPGDRVKVRPCLTHVTFGPGSGATWQMPIGGTPNNPLVFDMGDGTAWGEPADGVVDIQNTKANYGFVLQSNRLSYVLLNGRRYDDGRFSLAIRHLANQWGITLSPLTGTTIKGVLADAITNVAVVGSYNWDSGRLTSHGKGLIKEFQINTRSTTQVIFGLTQDMGQIELCDGVVNLIGASTPHTGVCNFAGSNLYLLANNIKFNGFVAGSALFTSGSGGSPNTPAVVSFRNVDFGGITNRGPTFAVSQSTSGGSYSNQPYTRVISYVSQFGTRDFAIDTDHGYCEWTASRNFPTLNARLVYPDRTDIPYSWLIIPPAIVSGFGAPYNTSISIQVAAYLPRISKLMPVASTQAASRWRLKMEFCTEESLAWTTKDFGFDVEYMDKDGVMRQESTMDWAAPGSAFTPSTETWSSQDILTGRATFVNNNLTFFYNKWKLELTTVYRVMPGTEVSIFPRQCLAGTSVTANMFLDPEIIATAVP